MTPVPGKVLRVGPEARSLLDLLRLLTVRSRETGSLVREYDLIEHNLRS